MATVDQSTATRVSGSTFMNPSTSMGVLGTRMGMGTRDSGLALRDLGPTSMESTRT